ncbi:MAG TPA: TraR/DksA C4-type zinc finger protein [Candidatus Binataceae bacterium]|nr:TraR/DksA C4-type zinc finger protein [Candidatus Binataceae bacterium]
MKRADLVRDFTERTQQLRNLLRELRAHEVERLKDSRRDEVEDLISEPSDDLEIARADEDHELHASLVSRSEDRLRAIEAALGRLDDDRYGTCETCGTQIPLNRLRVLPFTPYCTDCAQSREKSRATGDLDKHALRHWTVPEGMVESLGKADALEESEVTIATGEEFTPAPPIGEKRPARAAGRPKSRRK